MDDEEAIRDVMGLICGSAHGFHVTAVGDGSEAVAADHAAIARGIAYERESCSTLAVPGGVGAREAIGALRRLDPGVRALVSSGHARDPVMVDPAAHGFAGVVPERYLDRRARGARFRAGGPLTRPSMVLIAPR